MLTPLAHKLNFTVSPFDGSPKKSDKHITISVSGSGGQGELEPAPITEPSTPSFNLLASTVRHLFGNETIVSPIGMFGQLLLARTGGAGLADMQPTRTRSTCGTSPRTSSA